MSDDLQRGALLRSLTARQRDGSLEEVRLADVVWSTIEAIRHGDGRTWTRRLATGPGDVDRDYHLARPLRATFASACGGSWLIEDEVEASPNPPLNERCHACWRAAAASSPCRPALGEVLLVLVTEMAERDRETAGLREAARAEMLGEQDDLATRRARREIGEVTIGLPGDDMSDRVVVDEFAIERHATVIGGPEPYESIEIEWDVSDVHAGEGR